MENISANTVLIGKEIQKLPTCHSTNELVAEKIKNCQINEGEILFSNYQEAGKGQRGNSWHSNKGENLLFSFFVKTTHLEVYQQFHLHYFVSLALQQVVSEFGLDEVKIKWPNDIYISNKKVAGILIENVVKGSMLSHSIVGIGLNVNQQQFENVPNATSLSIEMGEILNLDELLQRLSFRLTKLFDDVKAAPEELKKQYLNKLYQLNEIRKYKVEEQEVNGVIVGIDDYGHLMVHIDEEIRHFGFKEITFMH